MKQSKKVVEARRQEILRLLKQKEFNVNDLSKILNVSLPTIRRDLDFLYTANAIERYYGGAKINHLSQESPKFDESERTKHAFAKYVANYIQDNDTVFINSSSTALLTIRYIKGKHVTIITNNAKAISLDHDPLVQIILTGGELRTPKYCMVGDIAIATLNRIRANKCIIGCNGISLQLGITTKNLSEVAINDLMISRCDGDIFVLASHSKIESHSNFVSAPLNDIDYLITDVETDPYILSQFEEKGIQTVRLSPLDSID